MVELIFIGVIKILDSLVMTGKSIATYKGKRWLTALLVFIGNLMFFFVIGNIITAGDTVSKVVVSLAAAIGTLLGFSIDSKVSKEVTYVNIITSSERKAMKDLGDFLRSNNIKVIMQDAYGKNLERTMSAVVFCATREQSKTLDNYVDKSKWKYLREIV